MERKISLPKPKRWPSRTAILCLVLFLCLLCSCESNSSSSSSSNVGSADISSSSIKSTSCNDDAANTNSRPDDDEDKDGAAIQYITSRISTWMKEKRKKNSKSSRNRQQGFKDDIILHQQHQKTLQTSSSYYKQESSPLPFVTLAYAQTLDGMIASVTTTSPDNSNSNNSDETTSTTSITSTTSNLLLSSPESMTLTHHLRNMHDAILVGGSTFRLDQPRLNVRLPTTTTTGGGSVIDDPTTSAIMDHHPMPIVLDTNLNNLQLLLFDKIIVSSTDDSTTTTTTTTQSKSSKEDTTTYTNTMLLPDDITIDKIKAHNPIICCSSDAAYSFLDILEVFQELQTTKKQKKRKSRSYKITVYKKIDMENDHEEDIYLPIKITITCITSAAAHHKNEEDVVEEEVTFTLLPCPMQERTTKSPQLDLKLLLNQLYNQFAIESVMVEGGAGILSSFMNECVVNRLDGSGQCQGEGNKVVDCICVTIAPKVMGGKWGLPVLGGFDGVLPTSLGGHHNDVVDSTKSGMKDTDGNNDIGGDGDDGGCGGEMYQRMMTIKDGEFVSLGTDSTFIGCIGEM